MKRYKVVASHMTTYNNTDILLYYGRFTKLARRRYSNKKLLSNYKYCGNLFEYIKYKHLSI